MALIDSAPAAQSDIDPHERPRIPLRQRLGYGLGQIGFALTFLGTISFLPLFYTDAVGLQAGVAGTIIVLARVLDAAIDPIVGLLAERTRSRFGRFRPWVLYGAVPLAALATVTFTAPFSGESTAAVVWAIVTYTLLGFAYSAVGLPYNAIVPTMAETSADRLSMNGISFIVQNIGLILVGAVTLPLVAAIGGNPHKPVTATGFLIVIAIFAALALPMLYIAFRSTKETVKPIRAERPPLKDTMRALAKNPSIIILVFLVLLGGTAFYGRLSVVVYYYIYNAGNFGAVGILIPLTPLASLVGTLVFLRFARFVGKRNLFLIGQGVQVLALVTLYLIDPHNFALLVVITIIHGMAGFVIALLFSMVADAIDVGEHKTGVRADGISFAIVTLSTKLATALSGLGIVLLGLFGYVANAPQTPGAIGGINFVVNLLPAIIGVLAIGAAVLYRVTDKQAADVRNQLAASASGKSAA